MAGHSGWREVLAVFQGVNSYITPSWYALKQETGKVVPTWNYAIVQVRGTARIRDDAAWLRTQIAALTADHEAARAAPWEVADAPDAFIAAQLKGIIGVEIAITAIDGKWKVSQNRPAADIARVAQGLSDGGETHTNVRDGGTGPPLWRGTMIIAIDGPAASGKGTLARRLADYYHLPHLDTGLSYRAVAHMLLEKGWPLDDEAHAIEAAQLVDLASTRQACAFGTCGKRRRLAVAVIPEVRKILVEKQRAFAAGPFGRRARRPRHRHGRLPRCRCEALRHRQCRSPRAASAAGISNRVVALPISTTFLQISSGVMPATWAARTRR